MSLLNHRIPTLRALWLAGAVCVGALACSGAQKSADNTTPTTTTKTTDDQSTVAPPLSVGYSTITVMAFGPDGTLFFADSGTGKIHSMVPPATENRMAQAPYNLKNIDSKLAAVLGTTTPNIRIRDLAVHPTTKEVYLAVGRVTGDRYAPALVAINQAAEVRLIDLGAGTKTMQVPFAPTKEFSFYGEVPARDLTFTDLEVHKGKLYIAGLSNADFSSTLWTVSTNFEGEISAATTEIYHAVHDQTETRAPIRAMKIVELGGVDTMVAAFTCTPLVTFPVSDIVNGAKLTGKTIGELGYGNTPGDLLSFMAEDQKKNKFPVLFLNHKNQSAQVIGLQAVEKAAKGAGLSKPVGLTKADLGAFSVPITQVLQVDEQDGFHIVAMRRDAEQGDLELVSYLKNVYFRLSDFQSEYEIPGYTYSEKQQPIKQLQDMMKKDEGHEKAIVK